LAKNRRCSSSAGENVGIPWKQDSADRLDGLLAERVADVVERGYVDQISMSYHRWFFNPRAKVTELDPEFLNAKVPYSHMFDVLAAACQDWRA
jgi:phosphotriesterase-related protein